MDLNQKLSLEKNHQRETNEILVDQSLDFIEAIDAIKKMRANTSTDYFLFGVKKLTEQKYFKIMHNK